MRIAGLAWALLLGGASSFAPARRPLGLPLQQRRAKRLAAADGDAVANPVAADAPVYAAALALQALPLADAGAVSHSVFFLGLSTVTVYLASRAPSLAPPDAGSLTLKQAALAPVFASAALGFLYALITVFHVDPSAFYRVLVSAYAAGASGLVLSDALKAIAGDDAPTDAAAGAGALALVGLYLFGESLGVDGGARVAVANVLAWSLALVAARTVPLRSFRVGALLLCGLFFYDVFFVFGSDVMVTVAKGIDAPIKLVAPNPPGSASPAALLGLGDVALPSLLVAFLGRYGDARGDGAFRAAAVAAYGLGLGAALYANAYVRPGQPALLYLVPAVIGAGCLAAARPGGPGLDALLDYEEPAE